MLEFLKDNWLFVLIALVTTGVLVYLLLSKKLSAYKLMLWAEKEFSTEEGKRRMDEVLKMFYAKCVPSVLKWYLTETKVRALLQYLYDGFKVWIKKTSEANIQKV